MDGQKQQQPEEEEKAYKLKFGYELQKVTSVWT